MHYTVFFLIFKSIILVEAQKLDTSVGEAIKAALMLHKARKKPGEYLIPGARGPKLIADTLDDAMQRLKKRMSELEMKCRWTSENGLEEIEQDMYWPLHDLKRKGISDADSDKIAGHKSEQMRQRYNVKIESFSAPSS